MNVIILGVNESSIGLAKSCLLLFPSIIIFDRDDQQINYAEREINHFLNGREWVHGRVDYCTEINEPLTNEDCVFDCMTYLKESQEFYSDLFEKLTSVNLFFTTCKLYSVTYIASLLPNPKCVVGLQFLDCFEDAEVVELVKGIHTNQRTLDRAEQLMRKLNKDSIIMKDTPGFSLNRMVLVLINEAIQMLNEGIATPKEIDYELQAELGMNVGPLKLADKIGLDNILNMQNNLFNDTGNTKYLPCTLLKSMVDAGYLGVKSNAGFFNYSAEILNFPYLKS